MKFEDAVKIHFRGLFLLLNFVCCWVINGELQLKYELFSLFGENYYLLHSSISIYLFRPLVISTLICHFSGSLYAILSFMLLQFSSIWFFSPPFFIWKNTLWKLGGSFFFPFTNRTHHLLFLFYHFYKHHLNLLTGSASGSRRFHVLFLLHSRPQLVWMGSAVRRLCVAYVLLPPFHMLCAPDSLHWLIILCTDVLHVSWSSWKLRGCVFEMWCIHAG